MSNLAITLQEYTCLSSIRNGNAWRFRISAGVNKRVFGDVMKEGFVIMIAELFIGGNTMVDLCNSWSRVLEHMQKNNLTLKNCYMLKRNRWK